MRDDPGMIAFVKQVEKHPCLWNYTLKDYNKREAVELAWKAISAETGDSEHNCRDRWKNVRCSFVRSYYNTKTKTRYYLADHLTFLLPYTKGKFGSDSQSVGNDDRLEDETVADSFENTNNIKIENTSDEQYESTNDAGDSLATSPSPLPIERERSSRERRFMMFNHKTSIETTRQQGVSVSSNDDDDTDALFFRSIMPDVKKLPDKQKRVFKRKVMTLLEDLLDENTGC